VTRVAGGADAILPRNVRPSAPHMTFPALVAKAMARNDTTVLDPLASTWYGRSRSPAWRLLAVALALSLLLLSTHRLHRHGEWVCGACGWLRGHAAWWAGTWLLQDAIPGAPSPSLSWSAFRASRCLAPLSPAAPVSGRCTPVAAPKLPTDLIQEGSRKVAHEPKTGGLCADLCRGVQVELDPIHHDGDLPALLCQAAPQLHRGPSDHPERPARPSQTREAPLICRSDLASRILPVPPFPARDPEMLQREVRACRIPSLQPLFNRMVSRSGIASGRPCV
jgi:hypothetical protein